MNIFRRPWAIIVLVSLLSACGGGGSTTAGSTQVKLTSISIAPASETIAPGTSIQFFATGFFSNSSKQNVTSSVTWTSSDSTIATISPKGVATALKIGSTNITATSGSIFGIATLNTSTVASIAVSPDPISIAPGTMQQFAAEGILESGDSQNLTTWAIWSSSDTTIAFIDTATGLATAVPDRSGSTIISAIYAGIKGTANLISSPVTSIVVSPASSSIAKGTKQQFTASGTLMNNAKQDLTPWALWLSLDTSVATFSTLGTNGLVTSANTGTTVIIASYNSVVSTPASLTVTPAILTSLTITPVNTTIPRGKTQQFIATGTFTDNSTQDLTSSVNWLSSAPTVASISSLGLATSLATGTTNITAISFDTTKTSNTATLSVSPAALESILVTPVSWNVILSTNPILTRQFSATGELTDGSLQDLTTSVTWASLDSNIVAISNLAGSQGLATVQVQSLGTTTITASFPGVPVKNAATVTIQN